MQSQYSPLNSIGEALFEIIYCLAKARDENALSRLAASGICLGVFFQGEYNAIILLAKEGDHEAVELLINQFKANRNDAVFGYAQGGHIQQVNEQIEQGASRNLAAQGYALGGYIDQVNEQIRQGANRNFAVRGYARRGYVEEVNEQIRHGANRNEAVWGYAFGNHVEQVNELLSQRADRNEAVWGYARGGYIEQVNEQIRQGADRDFAVKGYAARGYVEQVNELIRQGGRRVVAVQCYAVVGNVVQVNELIRKGVDQSFAVHSYAVHGYIDQVNELIRQGQGASREFAVSGYEAGDQINSKNILRLMSFTDDAALRKLLAEKEKEEDESLDVDVLQEKAGKLNKIMNEYQLNFKQSPVLMVKGARTWFLQGPELVRNNTFPCEVFFHITSYVVSLPLSHRDTETILTAINKKLFMGSVEKIFNNFKLGLFSTEKYLEEQHQTENRYQQRLTF